MFVGTYRHFVHPMSIMLIGWANNQSRMTPTRKWRQVVKCSSGTYRFSAHRLMMMLMMKIEVYKTKCTVSYQWIDCLPRSLLHTEVVQDLREDRSLFSLLNHGRTCTQDLNTPLKQWQGEVVRYLTPHRYDGATSVLWTNTHNKAGNHLTPFWNKHHAWLNDIST